jgi:hypothetical protein
MDAGHDEKEGTTMKDPRPNLFMVTALILALAALLAGPVQAKVIDTDGTTLAQAQQPFDGGIRAVTDSARTAPLRGDDGVDRGWYTGLEYADMPPVTSSSGDGFGWRDGGIAAGGGALLAALLASATLVATRGRNRVALP